MTLTRTYGKFLALSEFHMFDKLFAQDERTLLHRWDLFYARFQLLARAGQMAVRGYWEVARLRDVLATAVDDLLAVERELIRFRTSPAVGLEGQEAELWQIASEWVTALREWSTPPVAWTAGQLATAVERRKQLEGRVLDAIASYPFGGEPDANEADAFIAK